MLVNLTNKMLNIGPCTIGVFPSLTYSRSQNDIRESTSVAKTIYFHSYSTFFTKLELPCPRNMLLLPMRRKYRFVLQQLYISCFPSSHTHPKITFGWTKTVWTRINMSAVCCFLCWLVSIFLVVAGKKNQVKRFLSGGGGIFIRHSKSQS
jgi:hypothetical protein